MHVLPVGPPVEQADVVTSERLPDFRPIETNGHGTRHNIDGLLAHGGGSRDGDYAQLFRDGSIEAVSTTLCGTAGAIMSGMFEHMIVKYSDLYVRFLRGRGIDRPLSVSVTLLGVRGVRMGVSRDAFMFQERAGIDRNEYSCPRCWRKDLG